jgi:dienelactone hydrolase
MTYTPPLTPLPYADGATALTGWLARPAGPARAALLVWPTIANIAPNVAQKAQRLAAAGYLVLVGDFYGQPVESFEASHPLGAALRADVGVYRARLHAGLAALASLPEVAGLPIATLGYCMGGQAALELARDGADVVLAASFHGLLTTAKPAPAGAVKARVLVCHGDADPLAPRDHVLGFWQEMDAAGADWHFHAYAGVRHGFTDPASDSRGNPAVLGYNASADRQSWAALLGLLDEVLAG